jgi:hypothetical protein
MLLTDWDSGYPGLIESDSPDQIEFPAVTEVIEAGYPGVSALVPAAAQFHYFGFHQSAEQMSLNRSPLLNIRSMRTLT